MSWAPGYSLSQAVSVLPNQTQALPRTRHKIWLPLDWGDRKRRMPAAEPNHMPHKTCCLPGLSPRSLGIPWPHSSVFLLGSLPCWQSDGIGIGSMDFLTRTFLFSRELSDS